MKTTISYDKLPPNFYKRNVLTVARELLGKTLIRKKGNFTFAGIIVETEAYNGRLDRAAHSFNGKTKRNESMFKGGGFLYVYFTYGNHYCCNVVTGKQNDGCAVLIRAVQPILGIESMSLNRFSKLSLSEKELINLTNGPGKLCKAFSIDLYDDGTDLNKNKIFILQNRKINSNDIIQSQRVGITKSTELQWRFYIDGNKFVSRK